jgi:monoamine oxidase
MLSTLKGPAEFASVLAKVHQDSSGVTLTFEDGRQTKVDRAVLTLPPTSLERIVFEPPLTCEKRCAIEASELGRTAKITWEFTEPWWHDQDWGGSMLCDTAIQQTWDGGLGSAHILTAYINGQDAVDWQKKGDPVHPALYELAQVFPAAAKTFKRGWFHDWVADPFCRGSFSHLPPNYVLQFMKDIAPPYGRLHFAGEHTASLTGFIEGAIESAERVVPEIIRA